MKSWYITALLILAIACMGAYVTQIVGQAVFDSANNRWVNVTAVTSVDNLPTPTNSNTTISLQSVFNGANWDRQRSASADGILQGVSGSGLLGFNNTNFDRLRALGGQLEPISVQSRTGTVTAQSVSAADSPVSIVIGPVASRFAHLNGFDAFCSSGTSTITIQRSTGPTTVWSTPTGAIGITLFSKEFPVALTSTVLGDSLTVTLGTCGAANTGTLMVRGGLSI